jgi:hypothetical protein
VTGFARPTVPQLQRRREAALRYYLDGYSIKQIAVALGVASSTTVSEDLKTIYPGRILNRRTKRDDEPAPVDWRAQPPPEPGATDPLLRLVRGFVADMRGINYRNALAHAVAEAHAQGAESWLAGAQSLASELAQVSYQVDRILSDPEHCQLMATTSAGRDDLNHRRTP